MSLYIYIHLTSNTVVCTVVPRLICQRETSGKLTWLSGKSPCWVRNRSSFMVNFPLPHIAAFIRMLQCHLQQRTMPSKDWRACPPVCHKSIPAKEFCNLSNPYHSCHDYPSHTSKTNWMKHRIVLIEILDLTLSSSISANS